MSRIGWQNLDSNQIKFGIAAWLQVRLLLIKHIKGSCLQSEYDYNNQETEIYFSAFGQWNSSKITVNVSLEIFRRYISNFTTIDEYSKQT